MEKKKIMVVDDEPDIREILQFNLENAGYEVVPAASAEAALEECDGMDLILLDVMMEGMSGFRMAEVLRKERRSSVPIIFLTARSAENDLLTGFSAGGDDYIAKPFSINEVLARVKAVLKRSNAPKPEKVQQQITLGRLRIDVARKMVYVDDVAVVLPKKELEILTLLASHPGRIFSREEMINELWEDAPDKEQAGRVQVIPDEQVGIRIFDECRGVIWKGNSGKDLTRGSFCRISPPSS